MIVVHPQSIVHSLVQYVDGSLLAQLGAPDMRTPIAQALAWPERIASGVQSLDLAAIARLDFEPPDHRRFPSIELGARRGPRRRDCAGAAQCGQRGRGPGVSRPALELYRYCHGH